MISQQRGSTLVFVDRVFPESVTAGAVMGIVKRQSEIIGTEEPLKRVVG